MDLLDRLRMLMDRHGDTNASLAKKSGIPYTTIDGLFKRGWEKAQITTIQKLSQHYNVSLDYMVFGSDALSEEAIMAAAKFENLKSEHSRELVLTILDMELKHQQKLNVTNMVPVKIIGEAVQDGSLEMKYAARKELEGLKDEDLIVMKPRLI